MSEACKCLYANQLELRIEELEAEVERLREAVSRAIWLLESEALDADYKALGCLLEAGAHAALEGKE